MPQTSRRFHALSLESRRFAVLLVALSGALFVFPLVSTAESEPVIFQASVVFVLGAGLYAASVRRVALIVALVLLGPTAFAWLGPNWLPGRSDDVLRLLTVAASLLVTAVVVTRALMDHERVTPETLTGAINVYLLLVFAFALAHASVEVVRPGSYTAGGQPLLVDIDVEYSGRAFATIVYFSVTTLSTLGYGDIIPASEGARMLTSVEALMGQLYLAIFIGRLVGLEVGERAAEREERRQRRLAAQESLGP